MRFVSSPALGKDLRIWCLVHFRRARRWRFHARVSSSLGVTSPPVRPNRAISNSGWHGQILFDLRSREESDSELKGPCDQAQFFGFLQKADGPVTTLFFQDGDDGPQSNFCKTSDALLIAEHALCVIN